MNSKKITKNKKVCVSFFRKKTTCGKVSTSSVMTVALLNKTLKVLRKEANNRAKFNIRIIRRSLRLESYKRVKTTLSVWHCPSQTFESELRRLQVSCIRWKRRTWRPPKNMNQLKKRWTQQSANITICCKNITTLRRHTWSSLLLLARSANARIKVKIHGGEVVPIISLDENGYMSYEEKPVQKISRKRKLQ